MSSIAQTIPRQIFAVFPSKTLGHDLHYEVISSAHQFLCTQKDHPYEANLNPVIGLREVIEWEQAHKNIRKKHDDDSSERHHTNQARDAANPMINGFQ